MGTGNSRRPSAKCWFRVVESSEASPPDRGVRGRAPLFGVGEVNPRRARGKMLRIVRTGGTADHLAI